MLTVDLNRLHDGSIETTGQLLPTDPAFEGVDLQLVDPVTVEGRLQLTGEGDFYWHAFVAGRVRGECRRCLGDVFVPIDIEIRVLFSSDPETVEDPGVYPLGKGAAELDLGQAVCEELALAVPGFLVCRDDCAGLCSRCGANLNDGPCPCGEPAATV
ncbi:MAG: DUF177 domain-containing protein [Gemmatimonadetes bacterium]|nr:MAG: DUF177 domain-containing protein [Gemmatimonadota bacterium]